MLASRVEILGGGGGGGGFSPPPPKKKSWSSLSTWELAALHVGNDLLIGIDRDVNVASLQIMYITV